MEYSQARIEEILGLGNTTIYKYEKGISSPNDSNLQALAKLLKVSTDYLLGLTDEPSGHVELTEMEWEMIMSLRKGNMPMALSLISKIIGSERK